MDARLPVSNNCLLEPSITYVWRTYCRLKTRINSFNANENPIRYHCFIFSCPQGETTETERDQVSCPLGYVEAKEFNLGGGAPDPRASHHGFYRTQEGTWSGSAPQTHFPGCEPHFVLGALWWYSCVALDHSFHWVECLWAISRSFQAFRCTWKRPSHFCLKFPVNCPSFDLYIFAPR